MFYIIFFITIALCSGGLVYLIEKIRRGDHLVSTALSIGLSISFFLSCVLFYYMLFIEPEIYPDKNFETTQITKIYPLKTDGDHLFAKKGDTLIEIPFYMIIDNYKETASAKESYLEQSYTHLEPKGGREFWLWLSPKDTNVENTIYLAQSFLRDGFPNEYK